MLLEGHSGTLVDGQLRDVSADYTYVHTQHAFQRLFSESGFLLSQEEKALIQKAMHQVCV